MGPGRKMTYLRHRLGTLSLGKHKEAFSNLSGPWWDLLPTKGRELAATHDSGGGGGEDA